MSTPVAGYNIAFKIGGSTLAGRTQDDLTIAARTKESLTKDDQGATQSSINGHDITFRASGLVDVTGGSKVLSGNCVITNYTESSNASDDATYTVDFRTSGPVTFAAQ